MFRLHILDLAKKTKINFWYNRFLSTLDYDRKKILEYQNDRLNMLIHYVYDHIPYYRKIMLENKISPRQIKTANDLVSFPLLDRDIIRHEQQNLLSKKDSRTQLHEGSSSGTTGIPITYYHDAEGFSAGVASGYVLWNMSGWRPGQRNAHIWGNATSIQRWSKWSSRAKNVLMRQMNIPSILLDDPEQIESVSQKLISFNPVSIDGYPGAIFTLAQYFQKNNYSLKNLKQVLTTAENLENTQRELIEKILAPTADLYGSGEVLGIASRPIADNKYYVFEPHVIVETVASEMPGMKDIVVTDLDNYGMPMIRYKIGDMIDGLYQPEKDARYPFTYFKKIMGRNSDIILLANGKRFHPVNIFGGTLFRKFPEISRHKVVWNGESLNFIFEISRPLDENHLKQQLKELLAFYEVSFSVEFVNKLFPADSGKYRYLEIVKKTN